MFSLYPISRLKGLIKADRKLFSLILPIALERNGSPHQAQALVALNEYAKSK
jgi:hypothetical protein